jgi:hypothetical protein
MPSHSRQQGAFHALALFGTAAFVDQHRRVRFGQRAHELAFELFIELLRGILSDSKADRDIRW